MAFEWKKFLDLAQRLQQQAADGDQDEALLRTVFSRAYYAAFCRARNYARDWLNFVIRDDVEDHGRLRAHLALRRRKGDAHRLERLRRWRNEADHHADLSFDLASTVLTALADAADVFASLTPPQKR